MQRPRCNPDVDEAPSRQLATSTEDTEDIDTSAEVARAVDDVRGRRQRDEAGRFVNGNTAASHGGTLARSEALWRELSGVKRDVVERLRDELAVDGAASTFDGLLDAYAEAHLLRQAMFHQLSTQGGPITGKGRARTLFATYTQALDRELRLATTIGLQRRTRRVDPHEAVRRAVEDANREREDVAS